MKFEKEAILKHHWNAEFSHTPYRGNLHDPMTDEETPRREFENFLNELPDRTPIKITVEVLGSPRLDSPRWKLLKPHIYGPENRPENEICSCSLGSDGRGLCPVHSVSLVRKTKE